MDSIFAHRVSCSLTPLHTRPAPKIPALQNAPQEPFATGFESSHFILPNPIPHAWGIGFGGRGWIRTIVVCDNGFTVRSLWPLGNPSIFTTINIIIKKRDLSTAKFKHPVSGLFWKRGGSCAAARTEIKQFCDILTAALNVLIV